MEIRTHPEANIDFFESYLFYEEKSAGLGEKFYAELKAAYATIQKYPLRNRIIKSSFRILNLKTFPFQVVYSYNITLNRISVVAIHHSSKDPRKKFRKF